MNTNLTDEQFDKIITSINEINAFSMMDAVTLLLAFTSVIIALVAAAFTKHQRDVARRAEKLAIHTELLEILWYLKAYNGTIVPDADIHFKRLQKLRSASESIFSKAAKEFIDGLLEKMHSLPVGKTAYENEITPEAAKVLERFGVDPNIHDTLAIQYMETRTYFSRNVFEEFEALFPIKA